jgi:hypothetical protein
VHSEEGALPAGDVRGTPGEVRAGDGGNPVAVVHLDGTTAIPPRREFSLNDDVDTSLRG